MEETKKQLIDIGTLKVRFESFLNLLDVCLSHRGSSEYMFVSCRLLYLNLKELTESIDAIADEYNRHLPLLSDKTRDLPWEDYLNQLIKWQEFLSSNDDFTRAEKQCKEVSTKDALVLDDNGNPVLDAGKFEYAQHTLYVVFFGSHLCRVISDISIIQAVVNESDTAEAFVDYWHRELEHYTLNDWPVQQDEIRRQIKKKSEPKRPKEYENKIKEAARQLREIAPDAIETETLCVYEESLGRLLWSESYEDNSGCFDKLLKYVQIIKYCCNMIGRQLTVIGVEKLDNNNGEEEKLQAIEKAKQDTVCIAKNAMLACKDYLNDGYTENILTSVWDELLLSELAYNIAGRLNKSSGRELIITTVTGMLLNEDVFKKPKKQLEESLVNTLRGRERLSRTEKARIMSTYGSNMTPSKIDKFPELKEWIHTFVANFNTELTEQS